MRLVGGSRVARIVAAAAAKHLTPLTLEVSRVDFGLKLITSLNIFFFLHFLFSFSSEVCCFTAKLSHFLYLFC